MGISGFLASHCRRNRPYPDLCPESPCSSPVATGISGLHSRFTRGFWPRLIMKQKNSALFLSCHRYLLDLIEWTKGSQASCGVLRGDTGLLSRSCRKRMASTAMMGYLVFFLELWRNIWGFSRVTTGNSGSLSCGPREVQSPFELRGGARHCSRVTAGESGFKTR